MMKRSRLSLYYLASYLTFTGIGLLFLPDLVLRLLFSNRQYDDIFVRFSGAFMLAIAILVIQIIRHNVEALYPTSLVARGMLWLVTLWLYFKTADPFFIVVLVVIGIGMTFTGYSYLQDRKSR